MASMATRITPGATRLFAHSGRSWIDMVSHPLWRLFLVVSDAACNVVGAHHIADFCWIILVAGFGHLKSTHPCPCSKPIFTISKFGSLPSGSLMCSRFL